MAALEVDHQSVLRRILYRKATHLRALEDLVDILRRLTIWPPMTATRRLVRHDMPVAPLSLQSKRLEELDHRGIHLGRAFLLGPVPATR